MARGDKGYEKAKGKTRADEKKVDALMKKGETHGRPGGAKFSRKEIKILKGMDKQENG